jgi:hypothetical protein
VTLVYAFFAHARLLELLAPTLRLPQILAAVAVLSASLSGAVLRPFRTGVGMAFLLLTVWFVLGVPFSSYPSGTLMYLATQWWKNLVVFFMVVALISTRQDCANILGAVGLGSSAVALVALAMGSVEVQGRLVLANTSLNDPNTLGMVLLLGIPLLMSVVADRGRYLVTRLLAALFLLPIFAAMPLTGSRGTLFAALVLVLYLAKRSSIVGKAGLAVLASVIVLISIPLLSEQLVDRFASVTDSDQLGTTIETESRTYLFKQGFILTVRNPIFGVGAAMFPVAENDLALEQGLSRGAWHTCHNMFIQIASEGGLPAFGIYMWILWTVWKKLSELEVLSRDEHPNAVQIGRIAFSMKAALLAFCACGLFLSIAMTPNFLLLVAIPMGLDRVVRAELNQLKVAKDSEDPDERATQARLDPIAAPLRGLPG